MKKLTIGFIKTLLLCTLVLTFYCCNPSAQGMSNKIEESLQMELKLRDFDFLAKNEIALDVIIKNVGSNIIIVDYRGEKARSLPISRDLSKGIIQPIKPIELLSINSESDNIFRRELRMSNITRYRNSLEEGALFENIEELGVLMPGKVIGIPIIIVSSDTDFFNVNNESLLEIQFDGRMLMVKLGEVEIDQNWLSGTTLKDKNKWLAKDYIPVSISSKINIKKEGK